MCVRLLGVARVVLMSGDVHGPCYSCIGIIKVMYFQKLSVLYWSLENPAAFRFVHSSVLVFLFQRFSK